MSEPKKWLFEWSELQDKMRAFAELHAAKCERLTWYFGPASEFLKRLIGEGRSASDGPRPQDHVAVGLSIQAFRLALGSATNAMHGYADGSFTLNRSIWEIHLRLFDLREAPLQAALGQLIYAANEELKAREQEVTEHPGGASEENRKKWLDWRDALLARATAEGITSSDLKPHGRLNFATVATAAERSGLHNTLYRRHSLFAHGAHGGTMYTYLYASGAMAGEGAVLLPFSSWMIDAVGDAMTNMLVCLALAAQVIGEQDLYVDITHAYEHLDHHWLHLRNDVTRNST